MSFITWSASACLVVLLLVAYPYWRAARSRRVRQVRHRIEPGGGASLFVMVHAFRGTSSDFDQVREVVTAERPDADLMLIDYPSWNFSNADPLRIAVELSEAIEEVVRTSHYRSIVLLGYSLGSLLARKAFLHGCNQAEDAPVWNPDRPPSAWVGLVDRIILLAGTNRGWSLESKRRYLGLIAWLAFGAGLALSRRLGVNRLIRSCERGTPFVANLRVQWMRAARASKAEGRPWPKVIQLVGVNDEEVGNEDHRDVTVSQDFLFVPVAGTKHAEIVDFRDATYGAERAGKFREAIAAGDLSDLMRKYPPLSVGQNPNVKRVVFVLHGIRDLGDWTDDIEAALKKEYQTLQPNGSSDELSIIRSSYGYFALAPFLLYSDRQRNVRWFMDEYTEVIARCPNVEEIDFVGHSNGTYILASALDRYQTLRIDSAVFAGSVVPRQYDWKSRIDRKQVKAVRNYVGSADWVVGIFPGLFEFWGSREIGTAGFNGFMQHEGNRMEVKFIPGSHSCALDVRNHRSIVDFLLRRQLTFDPDYHVDSPKGWVTWASKLCPLVWLGLLALAGGLGYVIAVYSPGFEWRIGLLSAYVLLLLLILYRI